ncbi:MAG: efflux RND transporter periplasmic adaptor subunit [Gemmatimonadaceae bacterium]
MRLLLSDTVRRTPTRSGVLHGLLAAAAVVAVSACGRSAEGAPAPPEALTSVTLAPVVAAGDEAPITAIGSLGAKDEVTLSFKIGGIVAQVHVDDGAAVRRGQVLAELDQREIEALVAKATAAAEKSRRDASRIERLYHDSVATLAQWQDAQTGREAAEADLRAARVNHEFATILAPANGVVLSRNVSAGQLVGPGTAVIQFASAARGSVLRAGLPDRDAVRVKVGATAHVTFDAVPERQFIGRVTQVAPSADARTGTITVEVQLEGVSGLPSGLVGHLTITGGSSHRGAVAAAGVSAIPAEALVEGDGTRGVVFTVDSSSHRARRVSVTLVGIERDRVLVRGLDGVASVVRSGATWLTDSAKVEVKP